MADVATARLRKTHCYDCPFRGRMPADEAAQNFEGYPETWVGPMTCHIEDITGCTGEVLCRGFHLNAVRYGVLQELPA